MCWWEHREAQTLIYCWKKYRSVWLLWEKLWQILQKLNMYLYSSSRHRWIQWLLVVWVSSLWGKDEDFTTDRYTLFSWNIELFLLIIRNFNMLCCSFTKLCLTLCNSLDCSTPGSSVLWSLLRFMCFKSVMLSNHLILYCPHILLSSIFPIITGFQVSQLFVSGCQSIKALVSVLPVNIQGWFPLGLTSLILQCKGLSTILQYHNSKALILGCSAFFMVQLSHPYMTNGKTIALNSMKRQKHWKMNSPGW